MIIAFAIIPNPWNCVFFENTPFSRASFALSFHSSAIFEALSYFTSSCFLLAMTYSNDSKIVESVTIVTLDNLYNETASFHCHTPLL